MKPDRIIDYYILILAPDHPRAVGDGYVPEQILVAEEVLGRPLTLDEEVRHINENTQDNTPENLEIVSSNSGYRVVTLTDTYVSKPRKTASKTFVPCRYNQVCWKTVRSVIAKKERCYLPYRCSYQSDGDVYKCSRFWSFKEEQDKKEAGE